MKDAKPMLDSSHYNQSTPTIKAVLVSLCLILSCNNLGQYHYHTHNQKKQNKTLVHLQSLSTHETKLMIYL